MKPLTELFHEQESEFQERLSKAATLPASLNAAAGTIEQLMSGAMKSNEGTTVREERLMASFFSPLRDALDLLHKIEVVESPAAQTPHLNVRDSRSSSNWERTAAGVGAAAICAAAVPGVAIGAAAGIVAGVVATKVADTALKGRSQILPRLPAEPARLKVPCEAVHACLKRSAQAFDDIQAEMREAIKEVQQKDNTRQATLEDFPNVLDFLHFMLEVRSSDESVPAEFRAYLTIVERLLEGCGISSVSYGQRRDNDLFIIKDRSKDQSTPYTIRPALVDKDGVLIAKGVVVLPA